MFRLLKLGVGMMALAAVAWFGITVKLGSRTLFQHLRAIGQSRESQDLVDGTKEVAAPLVDDVRRRISGKPGEGDSRRARLGSAQASPSREVRNPSEGSEIDSPRSGERGKARAPSPGAAPQPDEPSEKPVDPQERLSSSEQRQLRELLRKVGR